ncbi:MAG: hypothetical protein CVU56_17505 [Deltaproteobacteria bacterium HGW-Deltaproteobacteria-14]|nr:MAG: hypothetical protein CVU56_17505 [Deltaproteobacteria bacterium HGW-Deltaproteobacteria-14]
MRHATRHHRAGVAALATALLTLGAPAGDAVAESPSAARRIDVVVFRPATGPGIVTVDSAARAEHLTLRLGLAFDLASEPLHAGGSGRPAYLAVERFGVLDVAAAVGLWDVVELGVQLPVVLVASGSDGVGAPTALSGAAVGDLRIVPKFGLGPSSGPGFHAALLPIFTLPTGASDANAGERGATFAPAVAVSYRFEGGTELALNLGYRARPSLPFGRLLVDDEFTFGLGGRLHLWRGLSLLAEVFGAVGVSENPADPDPGVDASEIPVEALGAVEYAFSGGFGLRVGGGGGLTSGWGAPLYRVFVGFTQVFDAKVPPDSDGDGLADGDDGCPEAAEDVDGFEDGDGCPDPDDDGDGIADAADACPREAEDADGFEDEDADGFEDGDGCPDLDNDGDGIADAADACPDQPETRNGVDDEDGCPDKAEATLTDKGIELDDAIYFVLGRATIMAKSEPLLDKVARLLAANPQVTRIRIEGHTDDQGPAGFNLELSKQRARAVLDALVARGVAAERLESDGFGSQHPVCRAKTPACWAKNRRTEFRLIELNGQPVPPESAGR